MAAIPCNRRWALVAGMWLLCGFQTSAAYQLAQRWTNTASGATGPLGNSITLTWSFADDGSAIPGLGESDLISFLDTHFGSGPGGQELTQRPWFWHYEYVFDRWSELGGVTYVYESHDDGVPVGSFPGIGGVRGDIRIAGAVLDGGGGVLALGDLPNNGDLVLDTGDHLFYTNPDLNYRRMHNVMLHEHGHGLGFTHLESANASFLMEPFFSLSFEGPQLDDIRGLHRAYGDVYEKSNDGFGNNSPSNATPLGVLASGITVSIGTDAHDAVVEPEEADFVSIDDNSDVDFFAFEIHGPSTLQATLTPLGPTYLEGPQGGRQSSLDSAAISDLALTILGADGISILDLANAAGAGGSEQIFGLELPLPGRYFARVTGAANDIQLYQLDVTAILVPEPVAVALVADALLVCAWCCRRRISS